MAERSCILFVDAYDSFAENIKALLNQTLLADIQTIRIDTNVQDEFGLEISDFLQHFNAIVLGPGPGDPRNGSNDVGLFEDVLRHAVTVGIPVLGICLGFQTLCLKYGLSVQNLPEPCHGHAKRILPLKAHAIYQGLDKDDILATCYNSLGVPVMTTPQDLDTSRPGSSSTNASFGSSTSTSSTPRFAQSRDTELDILATDEHGFVMAVTHRRLPFYGFQFHPESCKSNFQCHTLLQNWFKLVTKDNALTMVGTSYVAQSRVSHDKLLLHNSPRSSFGLHEPHLVASTRDHGRTRQRLLEIFSAATRSSGPLVTYRQQKMCLDRQMVSTLMQSLARSCNTAMLESTRKGRFSIYALLDNSATQAEATIPERRPSSLAFSVKNSKITFHCSRLVIDREDNISTTQADQHSPLAATPSGSSSNSTILGAIEYLMASKQATGGSPEIPFWGGFIGFMSYEMGLDQMQNGIEKPDSRSVDDLSLVWTERSLVYDSETSTITVQSLIPGDESFIDNIFQLLQDDYACSSSSFAAEATARLDQVLRQGTVRLPNQDEYNCAYDLCQDHLRAGNSYELCLTTEAKASLPGLSDDLVYPLYQNMHKHNPVPYGAFLDFENITILSTSPEEFMTWDRQGSIDMRPMKGTVKRSPLVTLAEATQILSTPKESAENLMIADLIRHDLYSAVGYTSKVEVAKLCEVIEHETVYQLVSHVQASAPIPETLSESRQRRLAMHYGFKALTSSLPPGSMTGAPKKRSCEVLRHLEKRDRGLYSGVIGYLDVGGGGAWNVCIRTAFRVKSETGAHHEWRIGAGGAITVLSERHAEWEEMQTKLNSVLRGFTTVKLDP